MLLQQPNDNVGKTKHNIRNQGIVEKVHISRREGLLERVKNSLLKIYGEIYFPENAQDRQTNHLDRESKPTTGTL